MYTPSDPIKVTRKHNCSHISNSNDSITSDSFSKSDVLSDSTEFSERDKFCKNENFSEQQHNTPREENTSPGVTAVTAVMMAESIKGRSSKKVPTKKNQVLLDSGSDGDLLFHKKGAAKQFPYLNRQVPMAWHASNGSFQTKRGGLNSIEIL